jgi:glycosyltransferase involved in cell wall biosynthesis
MKSLYLCYFGLQEPLVQTQVLPYLRELARDGVEITILTFEPGGERALSHDERETWRSRLSRDGIRWLTLPYHKRPSVPATLYDIAVGALTAASLVRRDRVDVLHARSQVPAAMGILVKAMTGCQLLFDMRGLLAEEYADAGIWKQGGPVFRAVKWFERVALRRSDEIVVLTSRLKEQLVRQGVPADKIEVIPCCVDLSQYGEQIRTEKSSRFEVIYAGSTIGLYLLEEMARFFLALRARRPSAVFRVLTPSPAEQAATVLGRVGLSAADFTVAAVLPEKVPAYLAAAHLGISFRRPTRAQVGASPTKVGEYLAAGLPVVSNTGIGDTDDWLESDGVGVLVGDIGDAALQDAAARALTLADTPAVAERCRRVAHERFDLITVGGVRYRRLYDRLRS